MDLLNDTTEEYKASLRMDPNFDAEHYDRLILELEEPQTLAPEDLVGFDQLDPIGTLGNATGPSIVGESVEASTSQAAEQPADQPAT